MSVIVGTEDQKGFSTHYYVKVFSTVKFMQVMLTWSSDPQCGAFKRRPECLIPSNSVLVFNEIEHLGKTFTPLVGNKLKTNHQKWRRVTKTICIYFFPFALCLYVEERFIAFVAVGAAGPHHFLSRLKTRASNVSNLVSTGD